MTGKELYLLNSKGWRLALTWDELAPETKKMYEEHARARSKLNFLVDI